MTKQELIKKAKSEYPDMTIRALNSMSKESIDEMVHGSIVGEVEPEKYGDKKNPCDGCKYEKKVHLCGSCVIRS